MISKLVYLTGGNGFLGSSLKKELEALGFEVRLVGRRGSGSGISFDLQTLERSSKEIQSEGIFIHGAWSLNEPSSSYHRTNVEGSLACLQWAKALGFQKIFFISSVCAYSDCKTLYGQAKLKVEDYCHRNSIFVIRPGFILSDLGSNQAIQTLVAIIRRTPILATPFDRESPVYFTRVKDLVQSISALVANPNLYDQKNTVLVCPKFCSLAQLIQHLAKLEARRSIILRYPKFLLQILWSILWLVRLDASVPTRRLRVLFDLPLSVDMNQKLCSGYLGLEAVHAAKTGEALQAAITGEAMQVEKAVSAVTTKTP